MRCFCWEKPRQIQDLKIEWKQTISINDVDVIVDYLQLDGVKLKDNDCVVLCMGPCLKLNKDEEVMWMSFGFQHMQMQYKDKLCILALPIEWLHIGYDTTLNLVQTIYLEWSSSPWDEMWHHHENEINYLRNSRLNGESQFKCGFFRGSHMHVTSYDIITY